MQNTESPRKEDKRRWSTYNLRLWMLQKASGEFRKGISTGCAWQQMTL